MAAGRNAIAVPAGVTPELPHFTHRLVHPRLRMNSCRGCSATVAGRRLGRRKGPREASRFTEERDRGESRPEGTSRQSPVGPETRVWRGTGGHCQGASSSNLIDPRRGACSESRQSYDLYGTFNGLRTTTEFPRPARRRRAESGALKIPQTWIRGSVPSNRVIIVCLTG